MTSSLWFIFFTRLCLLIKPSESEVCLLHDFFFLVARGCGIVGVRRVYPQFHRGDNLYVNYASFLKPGLAATPKVPGSVTGRIHDGKTNVMSGFRSRQDLGCCVVLPESFHNMHRCRPLPVQARFLRQILPLLSREHGLSSLVAATVGTRLCDESCKAPCETQRLPVKLISERLSKFVFTSQPSFSNRVKGIPVLRQLTYTGELAPGVDLPFSLEEGVALFETMVRVTVYDQVLYDVQRQVRNDNCITGKSIIRCAGEDFFLLDK
eukprot:GHVQ01031131.1.p1 GENE.GHVQ01031131.1~~GHVQ01031131.1.p1  ORF type:complete len:275 (-),score=8.19 GHVQ01031131.1:1766-2560(-)